MEIKKSPRYLYKASIKEFIHHDFFYILGILHDNFHGQLPTTSNEAWIGEVEILQKALIPWAEDKGEIIFEYNIPRLGKRIDVVVLLHGIIFCIEFKVGESKALQADVEQVMDYALDLKNFHLFSQDRYIVPILVPTEHKTSTTKLEMSVYSDSIINPLITGADGLRNLFAEVFSFLKSDSQSVIENWDISPYSPTPTIIEAARALYENHSVEDITRHEADKVSTDATIEYILKIINNSKEKGEKSICFVTGVPGAGKTLVGLDVAVKQSFNSDGSFNEQDGAVYLSGNGPLVAVLTEALARDNYQKLKSSGKKKNISDSRREVKKFIQIIHRYRDNMLAKIKTPIENGKLEIDPAKAVKLQKSGYGEVEHVAIFDEAQRAWTHKRIADYLKRGGTYGNKLKVEDFPISEAAFLIWSLDQREDWATIVCLVGGGQEINNGEAGISEWIDAMNHHFPHWKIYISDKLTEPEYAEGRVNALLEGNNNVTFSNKLHLSVSLRSFRAERLSDFVNSLLNFGSNTKELYQDVISHNYPIVLTRSMDKARAWLREQARGTQRTGILVSKVAARFKPLAVKILDKGDDNAIHWFLEDKTDVRASNYLEDAATEIQVQGLELDYACVLWDADMRYENGKWCYYKFNGKNQWTKEKNVENQKYMLNAYRVLMTRARLGLVICIPEGNSEKTPEGFMVDPTRSPEFYDSTYNYLKNIGIREI